jgi:hypothetical protein
MIETLKFPTGDFTHTELAQLNGKTNQQVWTRYQAAIKDGTIVSAGTRPSAGKGKPSKLWRLATGQPVPVAAVTAPTPATAPAEVKPATVIPTEAVVVPAAQPAPVVEAPKQPEPVVAEPVAAEPAKLPEATPATAPAPEAVTTVEVVRIEPAPEVRPPTVNDVVKDARTLTEKCPICGHPLLAIDDATGVMVWCAQGPEVCSANEAPFGHGKNDKDGYEILMQKWDRKVHA